MEKEKSLTVIEALQKSELGEKAVLNYLFENGEKCFPGEIGEALNVGSSRMAAILKQLERKQYIAREYCEDDGRRKLVVLKQKGKELVKKDKEEIEARIAYVKANLGNEKLEEFLKLLQEIKEVMEEYECCK